MAMKKISQLTEATSVTLTDVVEIEAAAGSRKAKKVNMLAPTVESVSANHTIDGREDSRVILMTTGGTNRTCELPDSSTDDVVAGDEFELHKVDAGAGVASLTRQGTDTIDGETAIALPSQYNYVRVRYLGSGLYTITALKATYDTGWVSNSDWANAEFSASHSLGVDAALLDVQLLVSSDGMDANSIMLGGSDFSSNVANIMYGYSIYQVSQSVIKIQTGANGVTVVADNGTLFLLDSDSWYYRIVISRRLGI